VVASATAFPVGVLAAIWPSDKPIGPKSGANLEKSGMPKWGSRVVWWRFLEFSGAKFSKLG
jgi:hypothetical protein